MRLDVLLHGWRERSRWEQLAVLLWAVVIVTVCLRGIFQPRAHTVYPIYIAAAEHWLQGEDLYQNLEGYDYYRYSPLVAIVFIPFNTLPDALGGTLWRLINACVYLGGLAWWSRSGLPLALTRSQRSILFLLVVPLSIGSLNNAQSNALVIGLLLAAMAATANGRWNLATLCVTIACFFKLYPIAIALLLAAIYPRRFGLRLPAALAAGLLLPFGLQQWSYVAGQYSSWVEHLVSFDRQSAVATAWYRDVVLLLRVWLVPLSRQEYLITQVLAGLAVAGFCLMASRSRWPAQRLLPLVLGLGCCWMTAFGPATESCTYLLLAPSLAWALLQAWLEGHPPWAKGLLLGALGLLVLAQAASWFPSLHILRDLGAQPFAALLMMVLLVALFLREHGRSVLSLNPRAGLAPARSV